MKYYLIAGEASGDLHASNLMKYIKKYDSEAVFRYWGGDLMQQQGGELVKHYRELSFMGFVEVLFNLRTILLSMSLCKKDIKEFEPDVLILVDYPGFNLRIAKFAKSVGIKVFYYISPKVWAWKVSRVKLIKRYIDKMFVILPFEKAFYQKFNYEVEFVGHPLLDALAEKTTNVPAFEEFIREERLENRPIVAVLPGSRKQEITAMLPVMLAVIPRFTNYQFVIAAAPSIPDEFYTPFIKDAGVHIVKRKTYELLQQASAALVTSGTATLETALFKVPQVVCYKASSISYQIAKRVVKVKYISLVNLIMDKPVIKELIQKEFTLRSLENELKKILEDESYRKTMITNYEELAQKLGGVGASEKLAQLIIDTLNQSKRV